MCGIVGYTGTRNVKDILVEGLQKLEYRGYDSAGLAVHNGYLEIVKSKGNIDELRKKVIDMHDGTIGIAHTRWATHGEPSERNSHPHVSFSGDLVMVHNGIIENTDELKSRIKIKGYKCVSDTDTEVLLNYIDYKYQNNGKRILEALQDSLADVVGSYAIVIIEKAHHNRLVICRQGSPLVIGYDETGTYVASDIYALADHTDRFVFPDDGDIVIAGNNGIGEAFTSTGEAKVFCEKRYVIEDRGAGKDGFDHYMLKEIFEQPKIVSELVSGGINFESNIYSAKEIDKILEKIERITILGCGTSWHSGLIGRYIIEKYARIPVNTEYASEYRYRDPVITPGELVISISQSGETADTLAANKLAREAGAVTMGILNVRNSTLERNTDFQLYLKAGAEIGVASTKAYTSQLVIISLLTAYLGRLRGNGDNVSELAFSLQFLSGFMTEALKLSGVIKSIAHKYSVSDNFLFLGRGFNYPSALEGALKLKEISYIHAEGYPGAEMKHGPIALIDYHFPTLAIVTDRENRSKMISNIQEIKARGGKVIAFLSSDDKKTTSLVDDSLVLPSVPDVLSPILTAVPLQLFAYYIAVERECNVDQPRNLAKSVTVE